MKLHLAPPLGPLPRAHGTCPRHIKSCASTVKIGNSVSRGVHVMTSRVYGVCLTLPPGHRLPGPVLSFKCCSFKNRLHERRASAHSVVVRTHGRAARPRHHTAGLGLGILASSASRRRTRQKESIRP